MIPYLLAVAGGYLIGSLQEKQLFVKGGSIGIGEWKKGTSIRFKTKKESQDRLNILKNNPEEYRNLSIEKINYGDKLNDGYDVKFEYLKKQEFAKGGRIPNWNSLTIDDMAKAFPYKLTKINKILRDLVSKRKVGQIYEFSINNDQSNKYDTFANLVFSASIKLQDTGSDTVTPGGTYFSQKGLLIRFYIRQTYRKDSGYGKITINASKDVAGGMNMYGSIEVFDISNIQKYISAILDDNKPNNLTDFVY